MDLNKTNGEKDEIISTIRKFYQDDEEYAEKVEKMRYELSLSDEEYIEKYAREVLGYHKSGEIVFKNASDR